MQRVEQAKEARSIYWHVPSKEGASRPRPQPEPNDIQDTDPTREAHEWPRPIPTATVDSEPQYATTADINGPVHTDPGTQPTVEHAALPSTEQTPQSPREPDGPGVTEETSIMPTPVALSDGEGWITPAVLQDPVWQSDPANDLLPPSHPIDDTEQAETQGADDWLDGIADEIGDVWLYGPPDSDPSPQTSMVTDPRTAGRRVYKSCKCHEH